MASRHSWDDQMRIRAALTNTPRVQGSRGLNRRVTQQQVPIMTVPAIRRAALPVLAVLALVATTAASHAAGTYEQRRACRADAMKFCRDQVPNVKRVTACMEKNIRKLSPPCRAQFR
jgi:hypothetical protein